MMKRANPSGFWLTIFFIGIVGMTIIIGLYFYNDQRDEIKKEKYEELSAIATLKASQIINYRIELQGDAKVITESDFFSDAVRLWLKNPDDKRLKNDIIHNLQVIIQNSKFKSIYLVDTSAKIVLAVGNTLPSPGEKTTSYLRETIAKKSLVFSDIYFCDQCADIHLDIILPLFNEGKIFGELIFRIEPEKFLYPLIQNWPTLSKTSESLLITTDGNEVVFINELRHKKNTALKLKFKIDSSNIHIPAVAATYGSEGLLEGIDYRSVPVLSDIRKIPDSPWWIIAKIDLVEVYSDIREKAIYISLLIGLLILVFTLAFFWLWKNQKKKLQLMTAQAKFELQVREIVSQKKVEEALRMKNWVFDASIAANSIADINGIITDANESFLQLWNYTSRQGIVGMPLSNFIQIKEEEEQILKALKDNGKWEGIFTAKKKDGSTFIAQSMSTTVRDENEKVIGYQSAVVDITERKKIEDEIKKLNIELELRVKDRTLELEKNSLKLSKNQAALLNIVDDLNIKSKQLEMSKKQLEATNNELESFSYSVSHDLRAPLRALDGFARIILEDHSSTLNSEGKRYLNIITDNAKNMGQLIDDLLAFSRLNRQEMQLAKINMLDLAKSVYEELVQQANISNIELKIESIPHAYGDYSLVKQVWRNLIGNAIKYGPPNDTLILEIGYKTIGAENIYHIKDNGVGFNMAYKDKLFGVFQRLHSHKEFEGTGVGLAIVQRIIHRLGGSVWAEGEENKGAIFYFTLQNKINLID